MSTLPCNTSGRHGRHELSWKLVLTQRALPHTFAAKGIINQPLAALASPHPNLTKAQSRHTQSEFGTFPTHLR
jgi:hypothetical protein